MRDFVFRGLDALGNLHLLLARQQRHLAHLLEIHPHRVVQNVQPRLLLLLVRLRLLDPVHFGLVHDFDLQIAQLAVEAVQFLGGNDHIGQRIVDVVVGQIALFARQANQFFDLLGHLPAGPGEDHAETGPRRRQGGLGGGTGLGWI